MKRIQEIVMKTEQCHICGWDMQDAGIKIQVAGMEITVCCEKCAAKATADVGGTGSHFIAAEGR